MKSKILYLPILMIMLFGLAGLVSGVATFDFPTSGSIITGAIVFNVSTGFIGNQTTNCSITGSSAGSGGSMTTRILLNDSTAGNNDDNSAQANLTLDVTNLTDASDWTFSGTCYNSTEGQTQSEAITAVTGVIVDSSVPVCSQSTLASSTQYDPDTTSTVTVSVTNATNCPVAQYDSTTIPMSIGARLISGGQSTASCTHTLSDVPDGVYGSVIFSASDDVNLTLCTEVTSVDIKSSKPIGGVVGAVLADESIDGSADAIRQQAKDKGFLQGNGIVWLIIIIIVVIAIANSRKK